MVDELEPQLEAEGMTPKRIGLSIQRILRPYYKGYPTTPDGDPVFRRSLTGDETEHILVSFHHLARTIMEMEQDNEQ